MSLSQDELDNIIARERIFKPMEDAGNSNVPDGELRDAISSSSARFQPYRPPKVERSNIRIVV